MQDPSGLPIEIFADSADLDDLWEDATQPWVRGFTTNPTLMRRAGVQDYEGFARRVLEVITQRPVSFEVFADEPDGMVRQARQIASWGPNVRVKIPITDTRGTFTGPVVERLSSDGVPVNVTAVMTLAQVRDVAACLAGGAPAVVSVFAGRIADTGVDPVPVMTQARQLLAGLPHVRLLWASPREVINVQQAAQAGCHIITLTRPLRQKLQLLGRDLQEYSLQTVRMFHEDAQRAGYKLEAPSNGASEG